ncbi:DHH family phosphoesterase [Pseudomonas protegens]|uniref:DHH family phosphoesterase n=1 Tax=Pseudomonas protegens TaxID=380021 RepID=UPI0032EB5C53
MIIVTAGAAYLDIDAYAGCIAYAEWLNLNGRPARALSSAPLNESIPGTFRQRLKGLDAHVPQGTEQFVLVDISNHLHLDPLVDLDRVVEVIDHHPGFEAFWNERLGRHADIRQIGAACTQVYQRWRDSGLLPRISRDSAQLLAAGILDNTLNFTDQGCTAADRQAYADLAALAGLGPEWPEDYFKQCQQQIEAQLPEALLKDLKVFEASSNLPRRFAQLTLWHAQGLLVRQRSLIEQVLGQWGDDWLLNLISLGEGTSYLLTGSPGSARKLERLLECSTLDGVHCPGRPILRKELLRKGLALQATS